MPIPKMVERKEEELIANGTIHQAERELSRKIGWNERHDIAEKRNEAIVERLNEVYIKMTEEKTDCYCSQYLYNFLQELQPPEQSPNEEG